MKAAVPARLFLFLLTSLAFACACAGERSRIPEDEVKVDVATVGLDRESGAHFVVLEDLSRKRELPILIGDNEAQAIMLELHGIKPERPMTNDLLRSIIQETGQRVDRVLIADLRDEVYYAKIYMDRGRVTIDSRPSDAIALAMGVNAPIYVQDRLFGSASAGGARPAAAMPELVHGLGITVQPLTPDLARYFGASDENGVLVSEVDPDARKAGVERGDIIVKVGSRDIRALEDFSAGIAAVKSNGAVVLTVRGKGGDRRVTLSQ